MSTLDQFRAIYITECHELLSEMETLLLNLDSRHADTEQLNAIFRCAHSIKGGSGAFGLHYITHFTHALEALLDAMRAGTIPATTEVVDALLESVDVVAKMVHIAEHNETPPPGLGDILLTKLEKLLGRHTEKPAILETAYGLFDKPPSQGGLYTIDFIPHETLFFSGNEPLLILRELKVLGETKIQAITNRLPLLSDLEPTKCYLGWSIQLYTDATETKVREVFEFVNDHCTLDINFKDINQCTNAGTQSASAQSSSEKSSATTASITSIRVDLEKVDRLINMVGELVITEAMLRAQAKLLPSEKFTELMRGIEELSQHTREIQEAVMAVRMQPVKSIFARIPRIVRDLSTQLGKDVRLLTSGENTEVDKTIIEQLADPFNHMIRNAVDHGIEHPADRLACGKPAQGTISLAAFHRGGQIIIEVSDDGGGINREKVLQKAKEKGLIATDAVLNNDECDQLIFLPGFSTAEQVSNVSGRGVGMDVVRRNIEALGGTVQVANRPGTGATFTVSLPLTLAILDGMIVRVGMEHYIIPITSIIESLRPKPEDVRRLDGYSDVINVRGAFIPVLYLHQIFTIPNACLASHKSLVVLVDAGGETIGLVVDELLGQQQVVIKSLEANADPVPGISGATILGDGRVSLILDINSLRRLGRPQSLTMSQPRAA
ncbi:MAG: chemotaxis protein CheA [Holosporales bacterium]